MQHNLSHSSILGLRIALLVLHIVNSFLHGFGTFILVKIVRQKDVKPQHVFLLGLSSSEYAMNVLEAIRVIPKIATDALTTFGKYLQITTFSGIWLVVYLMTVYITIDRLLLIAMKVRYHKVMSKQRAIWLLSTTWIAGGIFAFATSLAYLLFHFDWKNTYFKYFYSIIDFSFIILAVVTYQYIFRRLQISHKRLTGEIKLPVRKSTHRLAAPERTTLTNPRTSTLHMNPWKFYRTTILLVLTFLIFIIVPDMTYLFYVVIAQKKSDGLFYACSLSYAFANFTDVIIYLYMQPRVRKEIKRVRRMKNV